MTTVRLPTLIILLFFSAESHEELKRLRDAAFERSLLELMNYGLNDVLCTRKEIKQVSDNNLETFLNKKDEEQVNKRREAKYKIDVPPQNVENPETAFKKSDILILPVSVHDEASTAGTAAILQQYIDEFDIPTDNKGEHLTVLNGKIDLKAARERFLFYQSIKEHMENVKQMKVAILKKEKSLQNDNGTEPTEDKDADESEESDKLTKRNFTEKARKIGKLFHDKDEDYRKVVSSMPEESAVTYLMTKRSDWLALHDQYGRTLLHCTVELNNTKLTRCLLVSANLNQAEGCGLT